MTPEDDDMPKAGDFGAPLDPPSFDAGGIGDDDAFAIDLPADDEPDLSSGDDVGDDIGVAAAARAAAPTDGEAQKAARKRGAVMALPIDIVVAVGRARPLLTELVSLRRDSVLPLDSKIDDPVELIVGERVIARGELQEIEPETGRLGVRLTEVADPREAM